MSKPPYNNDKRNAKQQHPQQIPYGIPQYPVQQGGVVRGYAPYYPGYYFPVQPMYNMPPPGYQMAYAPLENAFAHMNMGGYPPGPMGMQYGNPNLSLEQSLVGKAHDVIVKEYDENGITVEFRNMASGLLQWTAFSRSVQNMENEQRLAFCKNRVPVGSQLNVYVNSVDETGMVLTLALKSSPILNYPALDKIDKSITVSSKYRYLVVVDLEATCDFSPNPVIEDNSAEIIEFPWVVIDTETLETIYEKQVYVKPTNMKGITPYCRVLTGITEDTLENGCTLGEAVKQFELYLKSLPEGSYRIVTDGVRDLQQLAQEAKQKGISLTSLMYSPYYNLKHEFRKFLPLFPWKASEPPLHIMLQALSLKFAGTPHRGIDDCITIALVVKTLLRRGYKFEEGVPIPDDNDPGYIKFSSRAPPGSWICQYCTEKYSRSTDQQLAVWNKPFLHVCRFCQSPK